MENAKNEAQEYRGHSLASRKTLRFPRLLLIQLIDEAHEFKKKPSGGANLHGWMMEKLGRREENK